MTDLVLREDRDGVAWLTLNRPDKLNALNVPLFSELDAHVKDIAHQIDSIGCVVLKGSGRCFSAGHDLSDISTGEKLPRPNFQAKVIEGLAELPQPVISAVHSHCYTGALELALAGDLIVASENGRFADTHGKWALQPVWGISQRLPRKVGRARATEMMMLGEKIGAEQAEDWGLIYKAVDDDALLAEAKALAQKLANGPTVAYATMKRNIATALDGDLTQVLLAEAEGQRTAGASKDATEGGMAFLQKRKPEFKGE